MKLENEMGNQEVFNKNILNKKYNFIIKQCNMNREMPYEIIENNIIKKIF